MAISIGDALLKLGIDSSEFDRSMAEAGQKVESAVKGMQTQLKVAGAAMLAVGVAGLKIVDSARDMNAQLGATGITIGKTTAEMRELALSTTNVTFPLKSVIATFDLLTRAGVKDAEQLKVNAEAFDSLADATGLTAEVVADTLIPAFKVFGVELPKSADELDKFTWLTKNTTVNLGEFGSVMQFVAMYGKELNLTIDDMIGIMAALEARGITGSAATRLFRTAVNQAKEGTIAFNDALGVSQGRIDSFKTKISENTGLTKKYGDQLNSNIGIMDRLKQIYDELTLSVGSFLTPLEPVFALLTALGPVILAVALNAKLLSIATAALGGVIAFATGPIGIAIGLTLALGAAFHYLWNKSGEAARKVAEDERKMTATIKAELVKQKADKLSALQAQGDAAKTAHDKAIELIKKEYGLSESLARSKQDDIKETSRIAQTALDDELTKARTVYDAQISLLDDIYDAKMKALNAETEALTKDVQDKIDLIDRERAAKDLTRRYGQEQETIAADKKAVASAKNAEEFESALKRQRENLASINRQHDVDYENIQKGVLKAEIDRIRTSAKDKAGTLTDELKTEKSHAADVLKVVTDNIAEKKAALDKKQTEDLERLQIAFNTAMYNEALLLWTKQQNLIQEEKDLAESFARQETAAAIHAETMRRIATGGVAGPSLYSEHITPFQPLPPTLTALEGYQHGGMIREPTLLYGMKSMRPYAVAGERGPERISPETGGSYRTANIYLQLDGRTLARVLGQPLVDEIRLRQGVRI